MGRIIARWQRSVASRIALDLPYGGMCSASYHLIRMAINIARKADAFFPVVNLMSWITIAKRPCYGQLQINPSYYYSLLYIYVVLIKWRPADSNECRFGYHCQRWASDCCNLQRGSKNKLISQLFYNSIINPSVAASSNPFRRGSCWWGVFIYGNYATRRENGTSWWGCLCDVCFTIKKCSEH